MTAAGLEARVLEKLASGAIEIPPLPEVAQKVLSLAQDENADGAALAQLVHKDAALASAILRLANSAALGGSTQIVSLQQAVTRLGMQRVVECALSVSLRDGVFGAGSYPGLMRALWRRSAATALYAKEVARELRSNVEVAFLGGLLYRVGEPIVLGSLASMDSDVDSLKEDEALTLARSLSLAAGAVVVAGWELPAAIAELFPGGDEEPPADLRRTRLAERLADSALRDDEEEPHDFESDEDATELNLYAENLHSLTEKAPSLLEELDATL